jgi:hypothetical protein
LRRRISAVKCGPSGILCGREPKARADDLPEVAIAVVALNRVLEPATRESLGFARIAMHFAQRLICTTIPSVEACAQLRRQNAHMGVVE